MTKMQLDTEAGMRTAMRLASQAMQWGMSDDKAMDAAIRTLEQGYVTISLPHGLSVMFREWVSEGDGCENVGGASDHDEWQLPVNRYDDIMRSFDRHCREHIRDSLDAHHTLMDEAP